MFAKNCGKRAGRVEKLVCALIGTGAALMASTNANAQLVISQVYGGGGNAGAYYLNDYIEIYNPTGGSVVMTNWSVQYASSAGTTWTVTALNGTIGPGKYFLVQEGVGTGPAAALPAPDASAVIAMSATDAKVALVNNNVALATGTPTYLANTNLVDFVGYGAANWNDSAAAGGAFSAANNVPLLANAIAGFRKCGGGTDTNNNFNDFLLGFAAPRNSATSANTGISTLTGIAESALVAAGNPVLLTATYTVCAAPPSTGGLLTADLTSIGGLFGQPLYDDGTNGDRVSGDGTFSYLAIVTAATTVGTKNLAVQASDAQGRSGGGYIGVRVGLAGPANDLCTSATLVAAPSSTAGTTVNATPEQEVWAERGSGSSATAGPDISRGPLQQSQENGVWYTVVGTGNTMRAQVTAGTFDARLRVYCGSCSQFSPVLENDGALPALLPTTAPEVRWCSALGTTYYLYVSGATTTTGTFTLGILDSGTPCSNPPTCGTCALVPPGGAILETEACGNVSNDGCNATPAVFQDILCGDTVFGSIRTYVNPLTGAASRDSDWYRFSLSQASVVSVTVTSEFPAVVLLLALSPGGVCPTVALPNLNSESSMFVDPCTTGTLTINLPTGSYVAFVSTGAPFNGQTGSGIFGNPFPCGTNNDYIATLNCAASGACCLPGNNCVVTTSTACSDQLGTYQGNGTACGSYAYVASTTSNVLEDISSTGAPVSNLGDDGQSVNLPLGFTFYYFGEPRFDVAMNANGLLGWINPGSAFTPVAFPTAATPNDIMGPYWSDLDAGSSTTPAGVNANIRYARAGTAPNRRFIVQWTNIPRRTFADSNTFQAIIFEGSNTVEYRWGTVTASPTSTFRTGLENFNGTSGTEVAAASIGGGGTARLFSPTNSLCGPPPNDSCATPLSLTLGNSTSGNTAQATNDGSASCDSGGLSSRDLWYTVTLPASLLPGQELRIDTCGSLIDTSLAVYTGTCGSLFEIACVDDCGGSPCGGSSSCMALTGLSAGTYVVRVSDKGGASGAFNLKAQLVLANDLCTAAALVAAPSVTNGTTVGATLDAGLPDCTNFSPSPANHGGNVLISAPGVWYRVVGTGGTITADTLVASYDTRINIYTGTCASPICVTANDDISAGFRSKVAFQTVLGQDYLILVSGFSTGTGTFTLTVANDPTPANDNCASAQIIGPANGSSGGTIIGATGAGFTPNSNLLATCATATNDPLFDVWFSYTAPCNGTLSLATCGAYDTLLSVHTACPTVTIGNQIANACNDNGAAGCTPGSQLSLPVSSGVTYLIRVAGAIGINPGANFGITWSLPDADGDGTPDACDGCPNDPLKIAPGVCGCGIPDTDSDGDGTPNCIDGCPNDPFKIAPGQCGCGFPDTDSDGDGTPDCVDGCPKDPFKTAPGQCGCGFPDTDTDKDGVADCNDGCPKDPLKTAPGQCGCGFPDTDTDKDGVADCNDGCPKDPDKTKPGQCGCGTPDTDTDGDGTADCLDGCPKDPLKTNPGTCGCGIPDTDSDGDGIPDCIDKCPGAPDDLDSDGDGTPDCQDGCPKDPDKTKPGQCGCGFPDTDTDGDGTADCNDGCPDDPDKIAPGICGCGTPETDTDGDGTPDCTDGCPDDPDKINPGICGCSVPDTDTDGDGTPDCNDACPKDPDKIDPGQCGCGNPDTDTDGDGVADCNDNCDDTANPDQADCDKNGIGDACEGAPDCNKNGIPDDCDIAGGASVDRNNDGIPDECQCLGDVDGDSVVNTADLLQVINNWGICPGCPADVNDDGVVNSADLLIVINGWGPC